LDHAFDGYNCCIFACKDIFYLVYYSKYWSSVSSSLDGQTGAGKSYSMVKWKKKKIEYIYHCANQ
jgi:hypothetical protein